MVDKKKQRISIWRMKKAGYNDKYQITKRPPPAGPIYGRKLEIVTPFDFAPAKLNDTKNSTGS